jgi:RecA-family ATPase
MTWREGWWKPEGDEAAFAPGTAPASIIMPNGSRRALNGDDEHRAAFARMFSSEDNPQPSYSLGRFAASTLAGRPVPQRLWHVHGLIPRANVTLLGGDGGLGKSLLAKQLAASTALAVPWLGLSVGAGNCLFVSAEDDRDEIHRRLHDITTHLGANFEELDRLHLATLAGEDAVLAVPDGKTGLVRPTALFGALEHTMKELSPDLRLVVLDTLADLFGGEENQRTHARQFISMLRGLAIRFDCAVLLLAHPSLSGMASGSGTSGSTSWSNSVRSRLYLERIKDDDGREADPDARVLRVMKANYGRTGDEHKLRWENGVFVSTTPPSSGGGFVPIAAKDRADSIFLQLLAAYEAENRNVAAVGPTFAPTVFAKDARAEGLNKRALIDAMNRLFAAKRIEIVEFGSPSHRRKRIAIASEKNDA